MGEISSPEIFLAAARKVLGPKPSQNAPVTDEKVSRDHNGDNHLSPKQPPQKQVHTSLSESLHSPPNDTRSQPKPSSELAKKPLPTSTTASLDISIHKDHDKKAFIPHPKPAASLDESIHSITDDDGALSKQASESTKKHPAKQRVTSIDCSIHSPQNGGTSLAKESSKLEKNSTVSLACSSESPKAEQTSRPKPPPESATKTSPKRPSTSLERSIHAPQDDDTRPEITLSLTLDRSIPKTSPQRPPTSVERSIHAPRDDDTRPMDEVSPSSRRLILGPQDNMIESKTSTDSTAKPPPKRLPASLDRSMHEPREDDALQKRIFEPVVHLEPALSPKLSEAVQPSFPTEEPKTLPQGSPKLQLDTFSANNSTQEKDDLLLDFNTTPTKGPHHSDYIDGSLMSPACEDLKGLDFAVPCPSQQVQSPRQEHFHATPRRKLDFGTVSTEPKESQLDLCEVPSAPSNNCALAVSPAEMEMLCKLLGSTSISEKLKESLQECKEELESKLLDDQPKPTPTNLVTEKPQSTNTSTNNTPARNSHSALSPQSQFNVAARSFVPRTSFQHHRSPTRSISSDSTQYAPSVEDKVVEKKQPPMPAASKHIIGTHLLPGRRGRSDESVANSMSPVSLTSIFVFSPPTYRVRN